MAEKSPLTIPDLPAERGGHVKPPEPIFCKSNWPTLPITQSAWPEPADRRFRDQRLSLSR